jgi:predicted DNA-binding WGR domain protein
VIVGSYCYLKHKAGTKDYVLVAIWDPVKRGSSVLYRQWGKIGTRGQHQIEEHPDWKEAQIELDQFLIAKENRGYEVVWNHRGKPLTSSNLAGLVETMQRRCPELVQWLKAHDHDHDHDEALEEMEQVMAGTAAPPAPRAPRAVEQLVDWGDW